MKQKSQTLIWYPDGTIAKRIDNYLYHPMNSITIDGQEWTMWDIYDEFDMEGWLVRTILLKNN